MDIHLDVTCESSLEDIEAFAIAHNKDPSGEEYYYVAD